MHYPCGTQHGIPKYYASAWRHKSIGGAGRFKPDRVQDSSSVFRTRPGLRPSDGKRAPHKGQQKSAAFSNIFAYLAAYQGTGVVTSVPSDSPDDYATLMDLRKKPDFYRIEASWAALDPVSVLTTPTYGDLTAPALVQKLKIQSQKDQKQLAEAKEIAYKEGFYNGTMAIGEFKGLPVQEAKPKVRASMIGQGLAFPYAEPEGFIKSRSGDECVVSLEDQWYLDYGESSWREQTKGSVPRFLMPDHSDGVFLDRLLANMETYTSETRHGFEGTLDWLNQWACARRFGLGSRMPWDPQFVVESLSDSTIYMCYYTVSHLLHGAWLSVFWIETL